MVEAFITGRVYHAGGEKEEPDVIHEKLRRNCARAARIMRATRFQSEDGAALAAVEAP